MSGSGYWNRPKQHEMPKVAWPRSFTAEQKHECLTDVYNKVKAKREITPEQFIDELAQGKIQISIEGQILKIAE
jgi:hypothetical protein